MCVFFVVTPFMWYQGQGHLIRSNIKVTFFKKEAVTCLSYANTLKLVKIKILSSSGVNEVMT